MWWAATARAAPCASRIGRALHGDSANHAWGVMDVLAVTDFPDVRFKSLIQSANDGSIIIIPREGGYLFRLYIELDKLGAERAGLRSQHHGRRSDRGGAADSQAPYARGEGDCLVVGLRDRPAPVRQVRRRARRGRRGALAARVHRRRRLPHAQPESRAGHERLDAGRLQSRLEAGVGAAQAVRTAPAAHLLGGTSGHRQGADRLRSRMGRQPCMASSKGFDPAETQSYFVRHGRYTAGTATHYRPSLLTGEATHQHLAAGLTIGMRFHSAPVIRVADAKPVHLGHAVKADGRWRIFAFAGSGGSRRAQLRHPRAVRLSRRGAASRRCGNTRRRARTSTR